MQICSILPVRVVQMHFRSIDYLSRYFNTDLRTAKGAYCYSEDRIRSNT